MTKMVLAHQDQRKAFFHAVLFLALFVFLWAPAITAGGIGRFLATESNPEKWLLAAIFSPFLVWIAVRVAWRAYYWNGTAIFIEGDRIWLANRWLPVSLNDVVDIGVTNGIDLFPGFSIWPPMLVLKRTGKADRKLATGIASAPIGQIAAQLRELLPTTRRR